VEEADGWRHAMIIALYIAAAVIMAFGSLYVAWRNRDFRKFLACAFFVSSGVLFYLYLVNVSVPLLGTGFVENTWDQRRSLHRPFHPLLGLFLFWLRQQAKGLKRSPRSLRIGSVRTCRFPRGIVRAKLLRLTVVIGGWAENYRSGTGLVVLSGYGTSSPANLVSSLRKGCRGQIRTGAAPCGALRGSTHQRRSLDIASLC